MLEQTGPGTMHVKDGWNFQRVDDGAVRIYVTDPKGHERDNPPLVAITIPANEWQSIIAGMSAYEDSAEAFQWAELFHGGKIMFNKPDTEHPLHRLSEL